MPDLTPGVPSALSPLVRRIVAPNPGPFTGPGTNTYLVGIDEVAVIDPGPDDQSHIDAIVGASMRERVRWVRAHPHASRPLAGHRAAGEGHRRRGARLRQAHRQGRERSSPTASSAKATRSRAPSSASTCCTRPGHAPNHLCFLLEEERVLFTGDNVLDGMFSVINPARGGDMAVYLATLARLEKLRAQPALPRPRRRHRRAARRGSRSTSRTATSARTPDARDVLKAGPLAIADIVAVALRRPGAAPQAGRGGRAGRCTRTC